MRKIQVLYLEENKTDAELVRLVLHNHTPSSEVSIAESKEVFCSKLTSDLFDIVLMDYDMPNFSASEAIDYVKTKNSNLPIIIISGAIGYETAIALVKKGADDYVLKDGLIRLPAAIDHALEENKKTLVKKEAEKTQNEALKLTQTGIFKTNAQGECFFVNQQLCDILGYSQKDMNSGAGWTQYLHADGKIAFLESYKKCLTAQIPFEIEGKMTTAKGEIIWIKCSCIPETDNNHFTGFIGTIVNITNLRKAQDELISLSFYDSLTNLPNRRFFENALQTMIEECKRGQLDSFAILYLDLDFFKKINDTLGHNSGDNLLKQAAARFQSILRKYDIIARIGGDEFLVILKHIKSVGEVAFFSDRFVSEFQVPFYIEEHECLTTLSIGVVYVDHFQKDMEVRKMIQQADQALYRAKARGRNCYELFKEEMNTEMQHTIYIENALRHAIEKNELAMYFQPQIDLKANTIFGFEALVRWTDAVYGAISPAIFIPIAEETGQIHPIGEWIIDHTLQSYKRLRDKLQYFQLHNTSMSINISAKQLVKKNFTRTAVERIQFYGLAPESIVFELTETVLIQNLSHLKEQFTQFVNTGTLIAIDDFGTGYSSFTNLKELQISVLKIDQSFVKGIGIDQNSEKIIKSIISLAKEMNMHTVAEGVETTQQANFLSEHGCHIFQGFLYARPMPEHEVEAFIAQWERAATLKKQL